MTEIATLFQRSRVLTIDSELDATLLAFLTLPGAVLEYGPLHPEGGIRDHRNCLDSWLHRHLFLSQDEGYVAFLGRYSVASALAPEQNVRIEIASLALFEECLSDETFREGQATGWYCIGWSAVYRGALGDVSAERYYGFYFDATGTETPGVYVAIVQPGEVRPAAKWFCPSFLDLLKQIIETRGDLIA